MVFKVFVETGASLVEDTIFTILTDYSFPEINNICVCWCDFFLVDVEANIGWEFTATICTMVKGTESCLVMLLCLVIH